MNDRARQAVHGTVEEQRGADAAVRVSVRGVRRDFGGGIVALDGIDLDVSPGEFVAILGPSGCGKSTLLRIVAGLDRPTSGQVEARHGGRIAYVFQDAHLLPWRNVLRNVGLPLELRGFAREHRTRTARGAIGAVGLAGFETKYPAQLSGGMRMRVSLARALVTEPRLLLLDEPFAALDEITRAALDVQLRRLWAGSGLTVIFVTHSTAEAVFLAERAVVLTKRPGRIVADHTIDLPATREAAVRATPAFARETRVIYEALERGGA